MALIRTETLRSLGFASISGTYAVVGTAVDHPVRMFRIINSTNGNIFVSDDGTNDKFFVPAGSFVLYDFQSNAQGEGEFVYPVGTQFFIKQSSAPSSGSVYLEIIYAGKASDV